MDYLQYFQESFAYPIPFGICVLISIFGAFAVKHVLESHRKDFLLVNSEKDKVIDMLAKQNEELRERIEKLENKLDSKFDKQEERH